MHSTIPHVGNYQNYSFNNQQALLSHKNKFTKLGRCKIKWNICFLGFFPSQIFSCFFLWNLFPSLKTFVHFLVRSLSPWLNSPWIFSFFSLSLLLFEPNISTEKIFSFWDRPYIFLAMYLESICCQLIINDMNFSLLCFQNF